MDNSPLGKLPAELRIRMYEYAMTQENSIELGWYRDKSIRSSSIRLMPNPSQSTADNIPHRHLLSLATTCKQLKAESLPVFLCVNHFNIYLAAGYLSDKCEVWIEEDMLQVSSQQAIKALRQWLTRFHKSFKHATIDFGSAELYICCRKRHFDSLLSVFEVLQHVETDFSLEADIVVLLGPTYSERLRIPISFKSWTEEKVMEQVREAKPRLYERFNDPDPDSDRATIFRRLYEEDIEYFLKGLKAARARKLALKA